MAGIQIAIDTPYVTKREFLRRTGMSGSTFERLKNSGDIPIMPKPTSRSAVLVNLVKWSERAAMQEV